MLTSNSRNVWEHLISSLILTLLIQGLCLCLLVVYVVNIDGSGLMVEAKIKKWRANFPRKGTPPVMPVLLFSTRAGEAD